MGKLAREGYPWIIGGITFSLVLQWFSPGGFFFLPLGKILALMPFWILTLYFVYFFRDPNRKPHPYFHPEKHILSPADGSLCAIQEEEDNLAIYIEMHLTNVHVCRAHIDGKVTKVVRAKGKHYPIYFFKKRIGAESRAIRKNARVIINIQDPEGNNVEYNLICGHLARRAKPYVNVGDYVKKGDRIGVISFGSLVKVTLPGTNYEIHAKIADKLKGGRDIIAEKKEQEL